MTFIQIDEKELGAMLTKDKVRVFLHNRKKKKKYQFEILKPLSTQCYTGKACV